MVPLGSLSKGGQHCRSPYLICISTLRLWRKCPAKARQSTGVSVAYIQPEGDMQSCG